jgi:ornithine--oxo-acid transaminase
MEKRILTKETHENVIRLGPPLLIDRKTIDWAVPRIKRGLQMR